MSDLRLSELEFTENVLMKDSLKAASAGGEGGRSNFINPQDDNDDDDDEWRSSIHDDTAARFSAKTDDPMRTLTKQSAAVSNKADHALVDSVTRDVSFLPTGREFQFFNRDGTSNKEAAFVGPTTITKESQEGNTSSRIHVIEDSWGMHTGTSKKTEFDNEDVATCEAIKSWRRGTANFPVVPTAKDQFPVRNIKEVEMHEAQNTLDTRLARGSRINRLREIYGEEIFSTTEAIDINNVLLDDDVVEQVFRCKRVEGMPFINSTISKRSSTWEGAINVAIIHNTKYNRSRLHFSAASGKQVYEVKENFFSRFFGNDSAASMDFRYKQSSEFSGACTLIPIPLRTDFSDDFGDPHQGSQFSDCIAFRVTKKSAKGTENAGNDGKPKDEDDEMTIQDIVAALTAGPKFAIEAIKDGRFLFPCFPEVRPTCCCKPAKGVPTPTSKRQYNFSMVDENGVGQHSENWTSSGIVPLHPVKGDSYTLGEWHRMPWYACCTCCCMEYRGDVGCRLCRPKARTVEDVPDHTANFPVYSVEKKTSDDVVIEFSYKKIDSFSLSGKNKLTLTLETEDLPDGKSASDVYSWAQRFVSIVGVEHGELYKNFEHAREAKAKENKPAEERKKKEVEKAKKELEEKKKEAKLLKKEAKEAADEIRDEARELEKYEDDKILRRLAREEIIKKKELQTQAEEEALALKALERKLLEAGKVVVREKCQCAGQTPASAAGCNWFGRKDSTETNLGPTLHWTTMGGSPVGCTVCAPATHGANAGTYSPITGTFDVGNQPTTGAGANALNN